MAMHVGMKHQGPLSQAVCDTSCPRFQPVMLFFVFSSILFQPSMGLNRRSGLDGWFTLIDSAEVEKFLIYVYKDLIPHTMQPQLFYDPGIINDYRWTFSNGMRTIVWIAAWNQDTCNLGDGGELINPKLPVLGYTIMSISTDFLFRPLGDLVKQGKGYGELIHSGVSIGWFPDDEYLASNPSDDDPTDRQNSYFEVTTAEDRGNSNSVNSKASNGSRSRNLNASSNSSRNSSTRMSSSSTASRTSTSHFSDGEQRLRAVQTPHGGLHPPASGNTARDLNVSTGNYSTRSSSFSTHNRTSNSSDGQRSRASHTQHGGIEPATNITNRTIATRPPSRKFPIDPYGDCDLFSLVLTTNRGPTYDDESTHGMQMLNPTDKIWSPNARFYLTMQLDCNLVLYDVKSGTSLWDSKTYGQGTYCYATITMSGKFIVLDVATDIELWATETACTSYGGICWTHTILQVQDDGNLVLYVMWTKDVLWASETVECDGGCLA